MSGLTLKGCEFVTDNVCCFRSQIRLVLVTVSYRSTHCSVSVLVFSLYHRVITKYILRVSYSTCFSLKINREFCFFNHQVSFLWGYGTLGPTIFLGQLSSTYPSRTRTSLVGRSDDAGCRSVRKTGEWRRQRGRGLSWSCFLKGWKTPTRLSLFLIGNTRGEEKGL